MDPTIADALIALAEQLPDDDGPAERVTVEQVNPRHYVARVYYGQDDEYEGYSVTLPE